MELELSISDAFSSGSDDVYVPDVVPNDSSACTTDAVADVVDRSESTKRVSKSKFEKYFTIATKGPGRDRKATCKICVKPTFIQMSKGNTTGVKKHLKNKHAKEFLALFPAEDVEKEHPKLTIPQMFATTSKTDSVPRDYDTAVVDWIAIKYLPFNFFNDEATQRFFQTVAPNVSFPKKTRLRRLAMARFEELHEKVATLLQKNSSKLSFTVDGWTSVNVKSYYGITTHFIDEEWNLQSITLDFIPALGKHAGKDIASIFYKCLEENNLVDKLQGITVDNASANTTFIKELQLFIPELNVEDCHFRCFGHIINLAVQDLFRQLKLDSEPTQDSTQSQDDSSDDEDVVVQEVEDNSNAISKIRTIFSKLRQSEQLLIKFKSACEATETRFMKPILDVPTRWNSTYDMLEVALKTKGGLGVMSQNADLQDYALTEDEWKILEEVHKLLANFKILSKKLEGDKYVTLPMVVVCMNLLLDKLENKLFEWNDKEDRTATDERLIFAFQSARDKIIKHYQKSNWIYTVILILDPRHKLETFDLTSWGKELKETTVQKFEEIYKTYVSKYIGKRSDHTEEESTRTRGGCEKQNFLIDFDILYEKESTPVADASDWKFELQKYYALPRCEKSVDVLKWWKLHTSHFPVLSLMAKDFFTIQATSVPAERLFSRAALTIRKHRNRLNEESARCLLCLNDWVRNEALLKE